MMADRSILRIGTRGSALALAQTGLAAMAIESTSPGLQIETVVVRTTADRAPQTPISEIGDKALWVVDLEQQLLSGEIDLAIHSMKDLPADLPPALIIGAIPERECPLDALALPAGFSASSDLSNSELSDPDFAGDAANDAQIQASLDRLLSRGVRVGTSSDRRRGQLQSWRPDLEVLPVRGNVDTRLRKLDAGEFDALILAAAGLRRLNREDRITALFPARQLVPAAGQGALALEVRENDPRTREIVRQIHHGPSAAGVTAERSFVRAVGGGCSVPLGVYTVLSQNRLEIYVRAVAPDSGVEITVLEEFEAIPIPDRRDVFEDLKWAEDLGRAIGARFLKGGGARFIEMMRRSTAANSPAPGSSEGSGGG